LGIGDWGLGIGDWGQSPIPNPQSPIPNPHINIYNFFKENLLNKIFILIIKINIKEIILKIIYYFCK